MPARQRLYDFTSETGDPISSTEVDAELDQLCSSLDKDQTGIDADNLSPALAAQIGANQTGALGRGRTSNSGEGTRTNVAFGDLSDAADQVVSIVVGTGNVVEVSFQALWKESVAYAAQAAIFIGATQLKVRQAGTAAPVVQFAQVIAGSGQVANTYGPLASFPMGLVTGSNDGTASTSDVTTGQAFGLVSGHGAAANAVALSQFAGGACKIHGLPAGTYTFAIKYKASSGTVTVKERKLWVEATGF